MSEIPSPVVIIGVSHELALLRNCVSAERGEPRPWGRMVMGRWRDTAVDVVLASAAIGKTGAAMGAQGAIEAIRPRLLLNCGSAGALEPGLRVGDLVLGNPVLAHDQGVYLPITGEASHHRRPDGLGHAAGQHHAGQPASQLPA